MILICFEVGNGGLTDDESISHFSLWVAVKSPLMMSNIMTQIDPQTLSILQNPAVIAINQDPASAPAIRRWRKYLDDEIDEYGKKGEIQLYSGSLSGGDQVILLLNAGTKTREMTASLAEIFWDEGVKGTAAQASSSWFIYDLWANRMSNATASAIVHGGGKNVTAPSSGYFNVTAHGGAEKVYSEVPSSSSKHLIGSKIGSVGPRGTVKAMVRPHGVAMYRLREQKRDEL